MSYEEDYRKPYSAKCACGKGYLQFYRIYLSNDWGQEKENDRKRQYCEQNGISLECIKYTASNDQERLEKAIKTILKEHGYKYFVESEKHDDWMVY